MRRSRGIGSSDEPFVNDSEKPMNPGRLVQEVEDMRPHDAEPADEEDENKSENGGEEEPEEEEEDPPED